MMTYQEIYERQVFPLPIAERLQLASLILRDVTQLPALPKSGSVDESSEWSEQDMRELSHASLLRFDTMEQENNATR